MNISELAAAAGVRTWTVRWYEAQGVLPASRRGANGYRTYGASDVELLRLVVTLRRLGLRPDDAGRAAQGLLAGDIDDGLADVLEQQLVAIGQQRADLDTLEAEIIDLRETIDAARHVRAGQEATMTDAPPIRVLFLCTGNSGRSQIAQALLQQAGGHDFEVESAGTEPKGVNPYTIRALAESGIDWSEARSKSVTDFVARPWDYVITVCDRARQACPVFPGPHDQLHWGLDDPAEVEGTDEQKLEAFRRTRMEIADPPAALRDAGPPCSRPGETRHHRVRAHVAEAVGTFTLVFIGCGAIAVTSQTGSPRETGVAVAFGLVIAVMIYALGHISGAHFNPAVSVAFALGGHLPWSRAGTYAVAQILGAIAGAWLLRETLGDGADLGVTQPSGSDEQALIWEGALSFFLVLVISAVATDARAVGDAAALAIGGAVAMGALVGGPISGASMNPARSIGPALVAGELTSLWIYVLGPLAGAVVAVGLYRYLGSTRTASRAAR